MFIRSHDSSRRVATPGLATSRRRRAGRGRTRLVAGGLVFVMSLALCGQAFAESESDRRIRLLEDALKKTQQQVETLQRRLDQQTAVTEETQRKVAEAGISAKTASAEAKKASSLPDWLARTTLFGDVRYRHEGFHHQPSTKGQVVTVRNRERVRARLGVKVALSDEVSANIRAATGNVNDIISTNETLTNTFNRKNFNLDWAFITFTPGASFGIRPGLASINAGKFPLTMFRTDELVFDEDVAPEGLNETFQLLATTKGPLDQVKLHAFQWTFAEIANKEDGWVFGGQLNPSMHFGRRGATTRRSPGSSSMRC
jgi:hypothetical protein